jgi:hypothetical protein
MQENSDSKVFMTNSYFIIDSDRSVESVYGLNRKPIHRIHAYITSLRTEKA